MFKAFGTCMQAMLAQSHTVIKSISDAWGFEATVMIIIPQ